MWNSLGAVGQRAGAAFHHALQVPRGDLLPSLTWAAFLSVLQAMDAAKGMLYLHSRSPPILHR